MVDEATLEALHREVRDSEPDVWEAACHRLGELAVHDQSAYRALCDLLLSSLPELRLRGLVALRILAYSKPREVIGFLTERVAEADRNYDPILLDATFFAFTSLPGQLGQKLVAGYLNAPFEGTRAAAAAALGFWTDWPAGTLLQVAQDSSSLVKAGLITSLEEMKPSAERQAAIEHLLSDPDPALKPLIGELVQPAPESAYAFRDREPFGFVQARAAVHSQETDFPTIARLEEWLANDPETGLGLLRNALNVGKGSVLLGRLSDACRSSELSTLLRAWSRIVTSSEANGSEELLLQVTGILEQNPSSRLLLPFREFVKACTRACDCAASAEMIAWSCTRQVAQAARNLWDPDALKGLSVSPPAQVFLEELAALGCEFENQSLAQLSRFEGSLGRLQHEMERACPRPERDLLGVVFRRWQRLLDSELHAIVGGVAL